MNTFATYADLLRPAERRQVWLYNIAVIFGFSLLIGLCAQIAIPLPFSPVPITAQTFAVLLTGAMLGSKRGSLAILTYITEGLSGLPVFAGGKAGLVTLFGPSGGYLVGYLVAALITGWLAERGWDRTLKTNFFAMLSGNISIYLFGIPWLGAFVGFDKAIALGLVPFIPGDILKLILATAVLPLGWELINRPGSSHSDTAD